MARYGRMNSKRGGRSRVPGRAGGRGRARGRGARNLNRQKPRIKPGRGGGGFRGRGGGFRRPRGGGFRGGFRHRGTVKVGNTWVKANTTRGPFGQQSMQPVSLKEHQSTHGWWGNGVSAGSSPTISSTTGPIYYDKGKLANSNEF